MKLSFEEQAMLRGESGEAVRQALKRQVQVGDFYAADDFVKVRSVHVMADIEAIGDPGLEFLESLAASGARFSVPVTMNPRSVDFAMWQTVGQDKEDVDREGRIVKALTGMGALPCHTCINYQSVDQPRFGEHLAWGDTGAVIYANSVAGARSNFEAGPAAVWAGLTGCVPRYGYHLPKHRLGHVRVVLEEQPVSRTDWGALGCYVGRLVNDYWRVPVFEGIVEPPTIDDLKHLGASIASYGSLAMFHAVGVTPEARTSEEAFGGREPDETIVIEKGTMQAVYDSFSPDEEKADVVVCGTPQLSMFELREICELLEGKRVHEDTRLYLTTNLQNKALADQSGLTDIVKAAGGFILSGVCFYIMTARVVRERHGYKTLVTDSAKLANIISGYGYQPAFRRLEDCVEAAVTGKVR